MKKISNKLIIVEKDKKTKKLDMPIYIGKAILDLTNYPVYDFLYNVVIKDYPTAKFLYMDIDSFIIEFPDTLEGFSNFVIKNREHFDLSECENRGTENEPHPLYHHLQEIRRNTMSISTMELQASSRMKPIGIALKNTQHSDPSSIHMSLRMERKP